VGHVVRLLCVVLLRCIDDSNGEVELGKKVRGESVVCSLSVGLFAKIF
jgi:hypothetical protein